MERKYLLLSFLVPLLIRVIPEVIAYPWPIGYDTIGWYAPLIYYFQVYGFSLAFYYAFNMYYYAPLFLVLAGGLGILTQLNPVLILEVAAPILSGILGFSIYYFLTDYLDWSGKRGLACVIISLSYFVALRISWDLLRNTLGLALIFLAVSQTKNIGERRRSFLFILFSLLCALTHEVISVLLFFVIVYLLLLELFPSLSVSGLLTRFKSLRHSDKAATYSETAETKNEKSKKLKTSKDSSRDGEYKWYQRFFGNDFHPWIIAMYTFTAIFTAILMLYYAGFFRINIPNYLFNQTTVGLFDDYVPPNLGYNLDFGYTVYSSVGALRVDIFSLFVICFLPVLPFAVLGYFRNRALDFLTLFLLAASFMPVVSPHFALLFWYRWMLLLTFPFTIYASNFLLPNGQNSILIRRLKIPRKTRRNILVVMIPVLFLASTVYMASGEQIYPYFAFLINSPYVPAGMQRNTIPLSQNQYAVEACEWLAWNMPANSCLIVHRSLYYYALSTLTPRPIYQYDALNLELQTAMLNAARYNSTYVLTIFPVDYYIGSYNFTLVFNLGLVMVYKSA
ncbi:MAG: hypothetical protein WED07_06025 [Candidatus Freyarchaeum deiterrae]